MTRATGTTSTIPLCHPPTMRISTMGWMMMVPACFPERVTNSAEYNNYHPHGGSISIAPSITPYYQDLVEKTLKKRIANVLGE